MKNSLILFFFFIAFIACESKNTNQEETDANHIKDTIAETSSEIPQGENSVIVDVEDEKEDDIPQGSFDYEIFQAGYGGRVENLSCSVKITGDEIVVTQEDFPGTTGTTIVYSGKIRKHKSGKWILSNNEADIHEESIGGCTGISVIDFDKKLIEMC